MPFNKPGEFKVVLVINSDFNLQVSNACRSIINALAAVDQTKRLGNFKNRVADIREHRWFQAFDWPALQSRSLEAPFKPQLTSDSDTKYFRANFTSPTESKDRDSGKVQI